MGMKNLPQHLDQLLRQAQAFHLQGKFTEAGALYARLLKALPKHPHLLTCSGLLALQQGRLEEAAGLLGMSLEVAPDQPGTLSNLAVALRKLGRLNDALACYDRALALKPDYIEAHNNRGNALKDLGRPDEALASFDRAIALMPEHAEAHCNRGMVLQELKRIDEALESYNLAFALNPGLDFLAGAQLHAKMKLCDWTGFDPLLSQLIEKVQLNQKATQPFPLLALTDSLPLQKKTAEISIQRNIATYIHPGSLPKRPEKGKIRIGYFSADYHNHATAYLIAGLIEIHNRDKFEVIAFSFGPDCNDEMRQRLSAAFDKFIDVRLMGDKEIAHLSRELEIDIAIDLKGFTQDCRLGIFAARAAPVQVNYLGYPGTTGAGFIDYLIADKIVIPEQSKLCYAEKIAYLPNSYFVNDAKRRISDTVFTPEQLGLPTSGFVFCCFNNSYKILPETFDIWMRILGRVEGSVLWLLEDNPTMARNLRLEAERRNVSAERLVFAKRMPHAEHLARHRFADLFIDTLPCNAHTTASDALWAGLPVLTCMGESFASRVAASVLSAINLPELITANRNDYETLAVALAINPEQLASLRQKLSKNRLTTPLFDTALFTRHIEIAYTVMYERLLAGQPPDHFTVAP